MKRRRGVLGLCWGGMKSLAASKWKRPASRKSLTKKRSSYSTYKSFLIKNHHCCFFISPYRRVWHIRLRTILRRFVSSRDRHILVTVERARDSFWILAIALGSFRLWGVLSFPVPCAAQIKILCFLDNGSHNRK